MTLTDLQAVQPRPELLLNTQHGALDSIQQALDPIIMHQKHAPAVQPRAGPQKMELSVQNLVGFKWKFCLGQCFGGNEFCIDFFRKGRPDLNATRIGLEEYSSQG